MSDFRTTCAASGVTDWRFVWGSDGALGFASDYPADQRALVEAAWAGQAETSLAEAQKQIVQRVKEATNGVFLGLYPALKQWAVLRSVPPYDGPEQAQMDGVVQELCVIQASAAEAIRSCEDHEALDALVEDLTALYGDDL